MMAVLKSQEGSHRHYIHTMKPGKVTIPFHNKDLSKGTENSIKKTSWTKGVHPFHMIF